MTDPYTWIDPFAEIAHLSKRVENERSRADHAYRRGREDTYRAFAEVPQEEFRGALRYHADKLAEEVAHKVFGLEIQRDLPEIMQQAKVRELREHMHRLTIQPLVHAIVKDKPLSIFSTSNINSMSETVCMEVRTIAPIQFTRAMFDLTPSGSLFPI